MLNAGPAPSGRNAILSRAGGVVLTAACLTLCSCNKVKEFLAHRKAAKVSPTIGSVPGGGSDPQLATQVQRQDGGVIFRKDLPFPTGVTSKVEERVTWSNGRLLGKSALGTETLSFNGIYETAISWKLEKSVITMQVEKAGPLADPKAAADAPLAKFPEALDTLAPLKGKSYSLVKTSGGWSPISKKDMDFGELAWAKEAGPKAPGLLADVGLLPRQRWFASAKVFKAGEEVELTGESLQLLFAGKPTGTIRLTYEDEESVGGQPAGRFAISGTAEIAAMPGADGESVDATVSISSGKIWCSLLHPVVLREDYEAVETLSHGQQGAPNSRIQGNAKVVRSRTWAPIP